MSGEQGAGLHTGQGRILCRRGGRRKILTVCWEVEDPKNGRGDPKNDHIRGGQGVFGDW